MKLKHPLHKLGRKNRNIISGLLAGLAAMFLVTYYLNVPANLLLKYLLAVLMFVATIAILALIAVSIFKLIQKLLK